jgi:hypothetical protein
MARKFKQGWFIPKHPEKYAGKLDKIRYMSSWELKTHHFLDNNPNILKWSSEEVVIPYLKPTDNRVHRYFPDYWVQFRNKNGQVLQEIWEVKPLSQTKRPRSRKPKTRLYEDAQWVVNMAKWAAATKFCNKYKMKFRILTEKDIYR